MNGLLSLLGFARRAGKVVAGSSLIERDLTANRCSGRLVLIARDATSSTANKLARRASGQNVPAYRVPFSMQQLGRAIGKNHRGYVMIKDSGFANRIIEILEEMEVRPFE